MTAAIVTRASTMRSTAVHGILRCSFLQDEIRLAWPFSTSIRIQTLQLRVGNGSLWF